MLLPIVGSFLLYHFILFILYILCRKDIKRVVKDIKKFTVHHEFCYRSYDNHWEYHFEYKKCFISQRDFDLKLFINGKTIELNFFEKVVLSKKITKMIIKFQFKNFIKERKRLRKLRKKEKEEELKALKNY